MAEANPTDPQPQATVDAVQAVPPNRDDPTEPTQTTATKAPNPTDPTVEATVEAAQPNPHDPHG